jgi:hypothetical protein
MQGFWAILPSFLAPEYTSRVFLSTDCHLFFLFQQALDNLCDRSTSLDPKNFHSLHQVISHALIPDKEHINYYQFRT